MIHDIFMPALSSTMTEGKIVSWTKSPGDKVSKGETVVVVESDKADMDVESFYDGYLATILVEAGQEAPVGDAIALIAETEAEIAQAQQKSPSSPQKSPEPSPPQKEELATATAPVSTATATVTAPPSTNGKSNRIVASPRAKKLAKQLGIALNTV